MTNTQIIAEAKKKLVADGKLLPEDEIHTYKHWKHLGYQVFRGEKAVVALNIWQYFQKADKAAEGDDEQQPDGVPQGKMRLKRAYFFSTQQVFALEGG